MRGREKQTKRERNERKKKEKTTSLLYAEQINTIVCLVKKQRLLDTLK